MNITKQIKRTRQIVVSMSVSLMLICTYTVGATQAINAKENEHRNALANEKISTLMTSVRPTRFARLDEPATIQSIFPDRTLANRLAEKLGKVDGDALVSQAELDAVSEFVYTGRGLPQITTIEGVQYLKGLTILGLNNHNITDLKPLSRVTTLESLDLSSNKITDITPLDGLTNLQDLNLKLNKITDVRPLAGLTNLNHLILENMGLVDISGLASLRKLEVLNLRFNSISDITPLLDLSNLQVLNLEWNSVLDVQQFKDATFPRLETLNVKWQKYTEPVARAHEEELIVENKITDVDGALLAPIRMTPNTQREPARYEEPNIIWRLTMPPKERVIRYTWQQQIHIAGMSTEYSGEYVLTVYGQHPFIFVVDDNEYERLALRHNVLVPEPIMPQKIGYRFTGWYTAPIAGDKWDFAQAHTLAGPMTLYAYWEPMDIMMEADDIIMGKRELLTLQREEALAEAFLSRANPRVVYEDGTALYDQTNATFVIRNVPTLMRIGGYGEYTVKLALVNWPLMDSVDFATDIKLIVVLDVPGTDGGKDSGTPSIPRLPQTGIAIRERFVFGTLLSLLAFTLIARRLIYDRNKAKS